MKAADRDTLNLADLVEAVDALTWAHEALTKAKAEGGQAERDSFHFQVGFARGRLARIWQRIAKGGVA